MLTRVIKNFTHKFLPPRNHDPTVDGPCGDLHVRVTTQRTYESAWEPTPEELAALNRGGSVILCVCGSQPPVALWVEE